MANERSAQAASLIQLLEKDVWRAVTFVLGCTTDIARDCLCSNEEALQRDERIQAFKHCLEVAIRELQLICEALDAFSQHSCPPEARPGSPGESQNQPTDTAAAQASPSPDR